MHWLLHRILIFTIHYGTHVSFLQMTSFLLRNYTYRINDAWGSFFWKSISLYYEAISSFMTERNFLLLKAKNFFCWNVSSKVKKIVSLEFNVKIHCEINVKLVFHEILWNKNLTLYLSLYSFLYKCLLCL